MANVLDKLKGVDIAKLNPAQIKKVAAALTQRRKEAAKVSSRGAKALSSLGAAKSAVQGSEKDLANIED